MVLKCHMNSKIITYLKMNFVFLTVSDFKDVIMPNDALHGFISSHFLNLLISVQRRRYQA